MPLDRLRRGYPARGVHGRVVHAIGQSIVTGEFKPGETLPREPELIDQFQVSRTAIRGAIKVLAAKGLVEARQKAGTRVRARADWNLLDPDVLAWQSPEAIDEAFIHDLVELRQLIEPAAARLAAERATPEEVERIERAYLRMEASTGDVTALYEADLAFHMTVFAACHNELVERLSGIVRTLLELSFRMQRRSDVPPEAILAQHRAVLEAIRSRAGAVAETAMRTVIVSGGLALEQARSGDRRQG